jgi:hypothetical protein
LNGRLAEGDISAANLVGPLAGQSLDALTEAIEAGNTYVNVHTNDFQDLANTGPGDFPGGKIRGQLSGHGDDDDHDHHVMTNQRRGGPVRWCLRPNIGLPSPTQQPRARRI